MLVKEHIYIAHIYSAVMARWGQGRGAGWRWIEWGKTGNIRSSANTKKKKMIRPWSS